MALRYNPDEGYDSWLARIQSHELKLAHQKLAQGQPLDQVMEELSQNLTKKFLHPIFAALHEPNKDYDMEQSRARYHETMKTVKPAADQVDTDS
jgi:glutamyl-tRNA reductase